VHQRKHQARGSHLWKSYKYLRVYSESSFNEKCEYSIKNFMSPIEKQLFASNKEISDSGLSEKPD